MQCNDVLEFGNISCSSDAPLKPNSHSTTMDRVGSKHRKDSIRYIQPVIL